MTITIECTPEELATIRINGAKIADVKSDADDAVRKKIRELSDEIAFQLATQIGDTFDNAG